MYEPAAVLQRLRENHLPGLGDYEQHLLVALVTGLRVEDIATRAFRSPRSVRRDIQRLQELISLPAGAEKGQASMLGWWVHEHFRCARQCLGVAGKALDGGKLFGAR